MYNSKKMWIECSTLIITLFQNITINDLKINQINKKKIYFIPFPDEFVTYFAKVVQCIYAKLLLT